MDLQASFSLIENPFHLKIAPLYDGKLKELHRQKSQKQHLESMKVELLQQLSTTSEKVAELERIKLKEQKDVEKIERKSITALIYQIAGNKEEKISKERQEAYAATMKYESAKRDLESIASDLRYCKEELQKVADWDMLTDNIFINIQKREYIESAQSLVGNLQAELRRFKTELADVRIQGDIQIEIDDFSKFADCFFDNIFINHLSCMG